LELVVSGAVLLLLSQVVGVVRYLDTRGPSPGRHRIRVARVQEARPPRA